MSLEVCFTDPWLDEVAEPNRFAPQFMEVTIAGRSYVLDTSFEPYRRDAFRHRSIQAQRESISLDNLPGEGTVNTEGLWRREAWDWHFGAGQPYQDRKDSIDGRFSVSKGINPWMQWQTELLSDTKNVYPINYVAQVLQVGRYVYVLDLAANTLKYSVDLVTWDTVEFLESMMPPPAPTLTGMATDGYNLWISASAGQKGGNYVGVWTLNTSNPGEADLYVYAGTPTGVGAQMGGVWYVADRLMTVWENNVYNIVTSGAPTALWTNPNAGFRVSAMCAGSSQIYIGGGTGGSVPSAVYRTTIDSNGANLTIPVVALPLEGGESCSGLYGYLNYVFVGSNLGLRMCRTIAAYDPTGNEGDLEAGPILPGLFPPGPVSQPVYAIVGNNRFVYFGWSNYDSESTGIGRCDLSTFIDTQAPAFASDLMVSGTGQVTSMDWCTINDQPIFAVAGKGIYTGTGTAVESGYVTSGYLGYGISDNKIALAGSIGTVQPQSGTVAMALAADSSSNIFAFVGEQNSEAGGGSPNNTVFPINAVRGNLFSVQMTLSRDTETNLSPVMHRWTLKAIPAITAGTTVSVVIRMWNVEEIAGQDFYFDPYVEKAFLENLRTTQSVFAYTEGPLTYPYCTIDEIDWLPEKRQDAISAGGFHGNIVVYVKTYDLGA